MKTWWSRNSVPFTYHDVSKTVFISSYVLTLKNAVHRLKQNFHMTHIIIFISSIFICLKWVSCFPKKILYPFTSPKYAFLDLNIITVQTGKVKNHNASHNLGFTILLSVPLSWMQILLSQLTQDGFKLCSSIRLREFKIVSKHDLSLLRYDTELLGRWLLTFQNKKSHWIFDVIDLESLKMKHGPSKHCEWHTQKHQDCRRSIIFTKARIINQTAVKTSDHALWPNFHLPWMR